MIFLDYRECGPQGEPKVVHIDQEYDYEITPLADTFEDFIRGLVNEEVYEPDPEEEKAEALELVRNAPFSPLLAQLCQKSGAPEAAERLIRELAVRIVEDKGYFALHAEENSYRLYDLQFWLYVNVYPGVDEQTYLKEYPNMLTFGGGFSTGGYAPGFVEDWLKNRKKSGDIFKRDGGLWMSETAEEALRRQLG